VSNAVTGTSDSEQVSLSKEPTTASVGSHSIGPGRDRAELLHPETQTQDTSLADHATAATSAREAAASEAKPPPEPPSLPPEPSTASQMSPEELRLQGDTNAILAQPSGSISLGNCTPEQQAYIIRYGMDIIADGDKPEFAAQVCASMAFLIQCRALDPLEQCTHEQQGYIIRYGMDIIADGDEPEFAAQVCASMATLIQTGALGPLKNCTPEQQAYIDQYRREMIADGNKPEFVAQVCASMATLFQTGALEPLKNCTPEQQAYIIRCGMDIIADGDKPGFIAQVCTSMATLIQTGAFGPLEKYTSEQQAYIIRCMNMIADGNELEFVAQVCASMPTLIQTGVLGPLENCTLEQQAYIIRCGMDMIADSNKLEFVAQVCASMATLFQTEALGPLGKCTPEQQTYIDQYRSEMIADGNKPEWAAQVCASMAILYQSGIEAYIPGQIDIENNQTPDDIQRSMTDPSSVVFAPQFIAQRAVATKYLADVMAANGADYGVISDYLKQQRFSSWNPSCRIMKYFLLQQLKLQQLNIEQGVDDIYYFEGNKRNDKSVGLPKLKKTYDKRFGLPNHLQAARLDQYTKSVAMYKAYTAIALEKTQFAGKSLANHTCKLQRAMARQDLTAGYGAYENVEVNGTFTGIRGGIADSTALGPPVHFLTRPERKCDIHEMQIPFSKIHAAYFLSPELCYDDVSEKKNDIEHGYGGGHEFVCDLSRLPVKLIRKHTT
jgi:hypothetical protein